MKSSFFRSIVALSLSTLTIVVWAADAIPQKIHHFAVIAPDTAKVGEAIDVTVEARDKDDKLIPTYHGSVFFQASTDFNATIPSQGKAIQFIQETDKGVKKFNKGVIFKKVGEQSLEVSDAVEDASGKKTIKIDAADSTTTPSGSGTDTISILTPSNNDIVNMGDLVTISGYGKKNSKVNVKLNGSEFATVSTDENGLYSKTLPTLTQQSNIVMVDLLDGTNKVLGTAQVRFSVSNTNPVMNSLTIAPNASVEAGASITLTVDADPGLSEVSITIDGSVVTLKEWVSGKYTSQTIAPAKPGSYPLTVNLKNALAQGTAKPNAGTLTVTEKALPPAGKFSNVRAEMQGNKAVFTFGVENLPRDLVRFKIAYGINSDNLSEQVMTKDIKDIQSASWIYTWYIPNLEPKNYTFRIFGMRADQTLISNFSSESVALMAWVAGCTIANVSEVKVDTTKDKSILSWLSVTGAISYNIYKFTAAGDPEFLQNTKEAQYVLFLASWSVVHEDFGIKALCDEKTESADITKVSKVQTGPWMLGILIVISSIIGVAILRRRNTLV